MTARRAAAARNRAAAAGIAQHDQYLLERPGTQRRVDLGLQARPATVAMLKSMGFLMRCPFCERPHDWRILTLSDWAAEPSRAQAGGR